MQLQDTLKKDSIATLLSVPKEQVERRVWKSQGDIDSSNLVFIENVFKRYAYPGISLVGIPTNEVAWYIIQHSDKIPQYIDMIKTAGEGNELRQR